MYVCIHTYVYINHDNQANIEGYSAVIFKH